MAEHEFTYPPTDVGRKSFRLRGELAAGEKLTDNATFAAETALTAATGKVVVFDVQITYSERGA